MEEILKVLLECGSLDLQMLDGVGYDLEEIVNVLLGEGIKPTLNAIMGEIFRKGQSELIEAVDEAIRERKEQQNNADDAEYKWLQGEIDELESLNPEEDMNWYCNCLATSCRFSNNEEIYRKYILEEISNIEYNMGFTFKNR